MVGEDYTKSRSRKQWTDRTEGVLKNIIDKLWESTSIPSTLINIPDWQPQGFLLTVNINEFDLVKDVAQTLTVWLIAVSIGSWAGTVNLTNSHDLCSGGSVSLEASSLILDSEHPTRGTRLTIIVPSNCPVRTYRVTVTGVGDSLKREVVITIHVGVPGIPPEGEGCKTDQECIDKYGSGYRCVNGQCLKICGVWEQSNCNDDDCPPGQKCIWNASTLQCVCVSPDFQLICPSTIQLYRGMAGIAKGTISLISKNGFAGSVSVFVSDLCQPECMKCAYPVLKYSGQSGNMVIVNVGAGETKDISLEITSAHGCPQLTTFHLEIEAKGGGKNHRCVINVEVVSLSSGGLGIFRFSHQYCNNDILVEFFTDSARQNKFAERTFHTSLQDGHCRSECFSFKIPCLFGFPYPCRIWWRARILSGTPGITYFYICRKYDPPNWGFCSGGTGWKWNQQWGYYWESDCICTVSPCDPDAPCIIECGACPEE